jgi:hypothetical protein
VTVDFSGVLHFYHAIRGGQVAIAQPPDARPPVAVGNMRANGVRNLIVVCLHYFVVTQYSPSRIVYILPSARHSLALVICYS